MRSLRRVLRVIRLCGLLTFTLLALAALADRVRWGDKDHEVGAVECGGARHGRLSIRLSDNYGRYWLTAVDFGGPAQREMFSWEAGVGEDEHAWTLSMWDHAPGRTDLARLDGRGVQIGVPNWFPVVLFGAWPLLVGLRFGIRRLRGLRRREHDLCQSCGYNLTGNITGRCPECGANVARLGSHFPETQSEPARPRQD